MIVSRRIPPLQSLWPIGGGLQETFETMGTKSAQQHRAGADAGNDDEQGSGSIRGVNLHGFT